MKRSELQELHYITAIENVKSILALGILCHREAEQVQHRSVAMEEIQRIRANKVVPGGRPLHEYVNLYFNARNKMMFKVLDGCPHQDLTILQLSPAVLDIPGAVITDQNASSKYALFEPSPQGLTIVDRGLVFAERWTHPDTIESWRRGSIVCAELLIPNHVPPELIIGAYVSNSQSAKRLKGLEKPP